LGGLFRVYVVVVVPEHPGNGGGTATNGCSSAQVCCAVLCASAAAKPPFEPEALSVLTIFGSHAVSTTLPSRRYGAEKVGTDSQKGTTQKGTKGQGWTSVVLAAFNTTPAVLPHSKSTLECGTERKKSYACTTTALAQEGVIGGVSHGGLILVSYRTMRRLTGMPARGFES